MAAGPWPVLSQTVASDCLVQPMALASVCLLCEMWKTEAGELTEFSFLKTGIR